jgi:hypothetical protein
MYKPWRLGEMAEKINIIDLQNRGVGIPMAKLSGAGGAKERDTLVQILRDIRGGSKERAFIVLEKDEEMEFLTTDGNVRDAAATMEYHRSDKAKAGGTEYFEQGSTTTGSRAGASALATGFFINVDAIRIVLEAQFNRGVQRQPGLVERLLRANFSPEEIDKYGMTQIFGSRVSPTEQLDNIDLLGELVDKGVIPPNIKAGNDALRRLGYDELTQDEWDKAVEAQGRLVEGKGTSPSSSPSEDGKGRGDKDSHRLRMTSPAEKKTLTGDHQPSRSQWAWPWHK